MNQISKIKLFFKFLLNHGWIELILFPFFSVFSADWYKKDEEDEDEEDFRKELGLDDEWHEWELKNPTTYFLVWDQTFDDSSQFFTLIQKRTKFKYKPKGQILKVQEIIQHQRLIRTVHWFWHIMKFTYDLLPGTKIMHTLIREWHRSGWYQHYQKGSEKIKTKYWYHTNIKTNYVNCGIVFFYCRGKEYINLYGRSSKNSTSYIQSATTNEIR